MSRLLAQAIRIHAQTTVQRSVARSIVRALPQLARVNVAQHAAAIRSFASRAQPQEDAVEEAEEEEPRPPLPLAEARSNVAKSLAEDVTSFNAPNEWLDSYVKELGFDVNVDIETESVLAKREVDGFKVQVTFRAQDFMDPEEEQEEQEQNEEEEQHMMPQHMFFVDITSPAGRIFRVDCSNAADGELVIENISFPKEVSSHPSSRKAEEMPETTGATDFGDLTDQTSDATIDLLESLGVDDDLALFVANQAQVVRTQKLLQTINQFKQFVQ